MSKHVGENCGKLCISSIQSSKRGITPKTIDASWWHSNLIYGTLKQSHMQNFISICQSIKRKVRKTAHFLYSKFTKRHNSFKNRRKMMTLNLDLLYIKTKSCAKFQLNMSKHVGEKCGKPADGDPDGRRVGRTDGRRPGRRPGRTSPYHNTSRLKTGV